MGAPSPGAGAPRRHEGGRGVEREACGVPAYGFLGRLGLRPLCVCVLPRLVRPFLNFPRYEPPRVFFFGFGMDSSWTAPLRTKRRSLDARPPDADPPRQRLPRLPP